MARICACINTYLPQSAECWTSQKQDTSGQVLHFTGWFKTTMCGHMFLEPGWRLQVAFMIQRFTKSIPRSFYIISSPINPVQTSLGHYFFLKLWGRWGLCPSPQWRVGRLCPSPFKRWKDAGWRPWGCLLSQPYIMPGNNLIMFVSGAKWYDNYTCSIMFKETAFIAISHNIYCIHTIFHPTFPYSLKPTSYMDIYGYMIYNDNDHPQVSNRALFHSRFQQRYAEAFRLVLWRPRKRRPSRCMLRGFPYTTETKPEGRTQDHSQHVDHGQQETNPSLDVETVTGIWDFTTYKPYTTSHCICVTYIPSSVMLQYIHNIITILCWPSNPHTADYPQFHAVSKSKPRKLLVHIARHQNFTKVLCLIWSCYTLSRKQAELIPTCVWK